MSGVVVFLVIISGLSWTLSEEVSDSDGVVSTRSYDGRGDVLEINDYDGGPFFKKPRDTRSGSDDRSFHSDPSDMNLHRKQEDLTKITLKEFLQLYAKKQNRKPTEYHTDDTPPYLDTVVQEQQDKVNTKDSSKSWTLVDVQKHKHPFEDKKGWVSLEPIPWSVSKISKWQSKYKPVSDRPWDEHGPLSSERPYLPNDDLGYKRPVSITPPTPYMYHHHQSTESTDRYDSFYDHEDHPRPTTAPNVYPRPTAYFGHKVHVEAHFPSNSYSSTGKPYPYHAQKDSHYYNRPHDEIMTDGMSPNFPETSRYETVNRRGTEMEIHPDSHPVNDNGEWVLLSTTKGYKPQRKRQRSLDIGSISEPRQSLRTMRGIKLTVLPPLKGSKVNMTTSHGGMLQVESTFESVEQAKQKFDKRQNTLKIKKRKRRKNVKKTSGKPVEQTQQTVATVPRRGTDPGAVMAAVGAGMIPATMAMMVPIAMNG